MKTLYLIGGTMGVGKTAACRELKRLAPNAVFLDGDWCWDMDPFVVDEDRKTMVMDNIAFCLNRFLDCPPLENIIFCWVMHEQGILDDILSRLDLSRCRLVNISLTCSEEALRQRLEGDIARGARTPDILERSLPRLPLYEGLDTIKLDTTHMTPQQTAAAVLECVGRNGAEGTAESGYTVIPYEEKYRDDMIFMVLEAKDALGRVPGLNADLLDVQKNYLDTGDMFWLAIDGNDRVIGCVGYNSIPGTTEVKLHRLYVKAARKHRGIGTCLLQTVERHLKGQGKTAAHVHLGGREYFESRSFYPKHGYTPYAPDLMKKTL